jgi:hypothetical protein
MTQTLAEHALCRVCDYLSAMGVDLTQEVTIQALRLVEAGLASKEEDPLNWIMKQVDNYFALHNPELPPATPPIVRGSLSYGA